ncbi:MAG: DUF2029 domain-containing protein [Saprospiraceae bacterium]|nr:DUF2029 domain-containing protein [Saprospiraceae bacterium]
MARFWQQNQILWWVYLFAALGVSGQSIWQGSNAHGYTAYENYVIFKNAFCHLAEGQNPYAAYPAEQWDLYKYSPAFALAMAPFSVLPDGLGLPLWTLLNALPLLWVILRIPLLLPAQRRFMAWFILPELVISMQNSQSNGLTAALLLLPLLAFEAAQPARAALWAVAGGFLKIFGVFAAVPALVYPLRWRILLLALGGGLVFFTLAPLLVLSPAQLWQVYVWWGELLRDDHGASVGLSVIGWLYTWFGWAAPKLGVLVLGLAALGLSALAVRRRPLPDNRVMLWASILIWVVIFNHKAESPTFVIALCGVALWYLSLGPAVLWQKILLWTAFALASLTPTDIFPRLIREQLVQPYVLKAVPCMAIWTLITWRLLREWSKPALSFQPESTN